MKVKYKSKARHRHVHVRVTRNTSDIDLTLRMHERYDHSYYFISTFMDDHLRWHAERLI